MPKSESAWRAGFVKSKDIERVGSGAKGKKAVRLAFQRHGFALYKPAWAKERETWTICL